MSRAIQDSTACGEALSRLPDLGLGELRQQWRALYKAKASPHLSRELLVRAVAHKEALARSHKAGAAIAFGTDMGVGPHGQNAREFGYMVETGMPSREAIKAARSMPPSYSTFPMKLERSRQANRRM
jgi:imidazolonepropionase-like amidohydrolase